MNANEQDDADREHDPVMDWALGERLGGAGAPDLVDAVRSRLRGGSVSTVTPTSTASRFLVAAAALLGVVVVIGIATWPSDGGTSGASPAAPSPQEPPAKPVQVTLGTDVAALPATTRAVEMVGGHDVKLAALVRLRDLESLVIREPWNEAFGLSLKQARPRDVWYTTAAAWQTIASFTKLRHLEMRGTVHIAFFGSPELGKVPVEWDEEPARAAEAFAQLERLPLLESLTLRCLDTPDPMLAVLPRLRHLRHLDVAFNHGFEEVGIDAILQCRSLRSLSLQGCQQLHGRLLARLGKLPELEVLDLSHIDGMNWRSGSAELEWAGATKLRERARRLADRFGMGPTDEALTGLGQSPKLRVLTIAGGNFTAAGIEGLGACRTLRELDLVGARSDVRDLEQVKTPSGDTFVTLFPEELERLEVCGNYTDALCTAIAKRFTSLRHLNLAACYQITDRGLAAVAAMPSLRVLDLRQMRGLTVASIDTMLAAQQLEELDVRHCDFVTAEHVVRLRRSLPNLRRLETSIEPAAIEAAEKLPAAMPRLTNREQIENLPSSHRAIEGFGLDDACMAALAKKTFLEGLALRPNRTNVMPKGPMPFAPFTPITDAGIGQLAHLPALRSLRLDRLREVTPAGLAVIVQMPVLEELHLEVMTLSDEFLARLVDLPLKRLRIIGCRGFGRAGVEAIARLRDLRELSLQACVHLDEEWIAGLAALPRLERLDLSYIGSHTYFSGLSEFGTHVEPGSGVSGRAIASLAKLLTLRELSLAYGAVDGMALRSLQAVPTLESLELMGTEVTAVDLEALPSTLTRLGLGNCRKLGQDFGPALAKATPRLHTLVLAQSDTLQDDCLKSLQAVRSLRALDLSLCGKFTAAAAAGLAALPWLEELQLRGFAAFGETEWAKLRALPNLKLLETEKIREVLRK